MSEPQFTPAPWEIAGRYIKGPGDNGNIARAVEYVGEWRAEGEANLRLIAAAPELYEALTSLRRQAKFWGTSDVDADTSAAIMASDIALAKARGEQS
jgi:hypothetical protein